MVGGVSPFNIADHVELPPFSLKNVQDLYAQYTEETNQPFTQAAVKKVYEETAGQPWLVNRLGTILIVNVKPGTVEPIDEKDVELYKETFFQEVNAYQEEFAWHEFTNTRIPQTCSAEDLICPQLLQEILPG